MRRAAVAMMVAVLLLATAEVEASGGADFDAGVAAFRDGRLHDALAHFSSAQAAGLDTPRLQYNLALTHYRLRHYDASEGLFRSLLASPEFEAPAAYHLGLIAERRGDPLAARAWHARVHAQSGDEALRALAEAGLERVRAFRDTTVYVFAGSGFDSNPALLDDPARLESRQDAFFETLADVAHQRNALLLDAGVYVRQHVSAHEFSIALLRAAVGRQYRVGGGHLRVRADIAATRADGSRLQEAFSGLFDWQRDLRGARMLELRGEAARILSAQRFDYLSGWRYGGEARLSGDWRQNWVRLGYRLELNDRRDLRRDDDFFSQSPLHQRLRLEGHRRIAANFDLEGRAEVRHSRYRGENRFVDDDGEAVSRRRREHRIAVRGGLRWWLAPRWSVLGEYEYTYNSASIDLLDYRRSTVLLGVEWLP